LCNNQLDQQPVDDVLCTIRFSVVEQPSTLNLILKSRQALEEHWKLAWVHLRGIFKLSSANLAFPYKAD
jgi:hypothetical protein